MIVEIHEMLCLLFIESTDYEDRMLYLQGLSNLELKQSLDYLAPIIVGQPPSDHHIQFLATWAVLNTAHANPNKVLCYNNTENKTCQYKVQHNSSTADPGASKKDGWKRRVYSLLFI